MPSFFGINELVQHMIEVGFSITLQATRLNVGS